MSDIHNNNINKKSQTALDEEAVLDFWHTNNIFEKSISQREGMEEYTFYDGPPFATGLPHYGHILPGTIKDVIPRYHTMQGKKVIRKWGWDCHGLPIENIIEKELNLNSRKDILDYGIGNFNEKARNQVLAYKEAWEEIIPRTGRWVDMHDHYKTMDASYTESCWWGFKELHKKGLVYKGYKVMHLCPRCETTLSNNEVAEGYADTTDISVTVKFELVDEPGTFLLAWTTTPWTLPGNTAIAVGESVTYAKVEALTKEGVRESYIMAQALVERVMTHAGITEYEEVAVMGSDALVGLAYTPPYDYYVNNTEIENHAQGWKVYEADFVTDEAGTGIAHEAPAFGSEDFELAKQYNVPVIHHVGLNGRFNEEVTEFAGELVKAKGDTQSADILVIKSLAGKGLLFSKEKIVHPYPLCWRCKTPLLNYATSSWFIATTSLRDKMIEENNTISWVPDHIGHKRFHNWIENNIDWAVSRSRFWGAPLPVWENNTTGEYEVIGSVAELKEKTRSTNNYIFIRHGESVSNVERKLCSTRGNDLDTLTEQGKEQVQESLKEIKRLVEDELYNTGKPKVDMIISSPFARTTQTAAMLGSALGVTDIAEDERLRERSFGELEGEDVEAYHDFLAQHRDADKFHERIPGGESTHDVKQRVMDFMYQTDAQHQNKTIIVVTHFTPYWLAFAGADGMNEEQSAEYRNNWGPVSNAKPRVLNFAPIPHDDSYRLDLHRPFSDAVTWKNSAGEKYTLIGEVFDCWYESGAMPFAAKHFMGEDSNTQEKDTFVYPADFICEAIDQTRGWFYSLLALGVGVFDKAPMKNVIVTGHVMAEDGKKMSKSLNNYPPVEEVLDKYGADALRFFLLNSPVMRGEKVNMVEKEIDDVVKKIIMRTKNVLSFYETYAPETVNNAEPSSSPNVLDRWIISRLNQVIEEATSGLDAYELDRACKGFLDFVDDFSTWYVRRSRDRFKGEDETDKAYAQATTWYVLRTLSKVLAPFMPFVADHVWSRVRVGRDQESVHLEMWPARGEVDEASLIEMAMVREYVSRGLDARVTAGIKVRQPLAKLTIKLPVVDKEPVVLGDALLEIIRDELNVKEVVVDQHAAEEIMLDTALTPELQEEGDFREFLRQMQTARKNAGLSPHDTITLKLSISEEGEVMIRKYFAELERVAGVAQVDFVDALPDEEDQLANKIVYRVHIDTV